MDDTRERVIAHYREMAEQMPQYMPIRMAELAPGIIAVEDASGECDTLFDVDGWKFRTPEIWGGQGPKSPTLGKRNLNVLEGLGRRPPVSNIRTMVGFAKDHIVPKNGGAWHEEPMEFDF